MSATKHAVYTSLEDAYSELQSLGASDFVIQDKEFHARSTQNPNVTYHARAHPTSNGALEWRVHKEFNKPLPDTIQKQLRRPKQDHCAFMKNPSSYISQQLLIGEGYFQTATTINTRSSPPKV